MHEISPNILKELTNELIPIMTHFFQQTMDKSTLPEDWTTANICSALSTSLSVVVLFLVWCLEAEYSEYLFSLMIDSLIKQQSGF
jgi:hypothetical protein